MQTDLSFLNEGELFPPKLEKERIERYRQHERLFLSQHPEAWETDFTALANRLHVKPQRVETIFNYHQLLSKKICDFICSEPPKLDDGTESSALKMTLDKADFFSKLYEAFIDVTRYGNGIFKLIGNRASIVNPMYWIPVVAPDDLKQITHHVICYPIRPDKNGKYTAAYIEIHEPGKITQRYATLGDLGSNDPHDSYYAGKIGANIQEDAVLLTGNDGFAVYPLTNTTHSGSIYGLDDYAVVNSIVQKIMWRMHRADVILDKHSEPTMSGPTSALRFDEVTKMYYFDLGNYFKRDSEHDPALQYVTWDGNLDANFKEIELLFQQLYTLTEMGQAFTEGGGGGSATSARALKLRMVSPLAKAKRIAEMNTATVKNLVIALAALNNVTISPEALNLTWNDGLPEDEAEQVTTLVAATGGKAVMSQKTAIMKRGLTDEQAEDELEQMREEAAAAAPLDLGVLDPNADKNPEGKVKDDGNGTGD